jgi:hypothetical protein
LSTILWFAVTAGVVVFAAKPQRLRSTLVGTPGRGLQQSRRRRGGGRAECGAQSRQLT